MLREDEKIVADYITSEGGLSEIPEAIALIKEHLTKVHLTAKGEPFKTKNDRLAQWDPKEEDIYEIIIAIFTSCISHGATTYQCMTGMMNSKVDMEIHIDRAQTMAELIALISKTGLIDLYRSGSGQYIMIDTEYELDIELPLVDRHGTAYHRAQTVTSNFDPEQGSLLLGGKFNHHDGVICLDHINKMNSIPLTLDREYVLTYVEEPKEEYIKDTDAQRKIDQKWKMWDLYQEKAQEKYFELITDKNQKDNICYLNHKYCTRGRTYAKGYYLNTQGSSFKKACLQFANKEYLKEN